MQTDYLQYIFQAINTLLTQNLGFFDAMGQNLFRSFATILVVWYGVKSALSAASGKYTFQFDNFASLLLTISFGFAMVNYYSAPIPSIGVSFHNLITNEAQFLSGQIDQAQLQSLVTHVADFESRMDSPTWGDILGTFIYVIVTILLAAAQAVAIVVIAYGFYPVFHRSENGVALLGLVPLLYPIRLLPGHRSGCSFRHRESHSRHSPASPRRGTVNGAAHRLVSRTFHYVSRLHLRTA